MGVCNDNRKKGMNMREYEEGDMGGARGRKRQWEMM